MSTPEGTLALVNAAVAHLNPDECAPDCPAHPVEHAVARLLLAALAEAADLVRHVTPTTTYDGTLGNYGAERLLVASIPHWRPTIVVAAAVLGGDLRPEHRVGQEIRRVDPLSFNRDLWGRVRAVVPSTGRGRGVAYGVRWADGGSALWGADDPEAVFEFREPPPLTPNR